MTIRSSGDRTWQLFLSLIALLLHVSLAMRYGPAAVAIFVFLLISGRSPAEELGTLKGQFILDGIPEKPKSVVKAGALTTDESLLVDADSLGIANVIVSMYDEDVERLPIAPLRGASMIINATDKGIEPRVTLISTRQALVITNTDKVGHAIKSSLVANAPFAVPLKPGDEVSLAFPKVEKLPIQIDDAIHPWMRGYLFITDSHAAVSNHEGRFEIKDLSPGKWTFRVWHERSGYVEHVTRGDKPVFWKKGRMTLEVRPGENNLGVIRVSTKEFQED